jgi:hypothetical protein
LLQTRFPGMVQSVRNDLPSPKAKVERCDHSGSTVISSATSREGGKHGYMYEL